MIVRKLACVFLGRPDPAGERQGMPAEPRHLPRAALGSTEWADFANANPDGSAWDAFTLTRCSDD
ncbi:msr8578 [Mesorhizobium japonicum MAFF 303099]|uniref:Msr8578 protein n=1 Tax=Mesorhizobium japonicum (strain LMG 29417 / CECT 9101 / MAFF 303099) TaxID=266835 RepID=Q98NH8_RHILO|nr:msr8578 [Mesorhizobium japonicum MAFF 303099]